MFFIIGSFEPRNPRIPSKKVKCSRYRPDVVQRVGRGTALLFHDGGTRRGWVVSGTPRPHFTPGKVPVPILQEAGWAPGLVWTGGKSRPHRDSIPDRPARSQPLYWLSYLAHRTPSRSSSNYLRAISDLLYLSRSTNAKKLWNKKGKLRKFAEENIWP